MRKVWIEAKSLRTSPVPLTLRARSPPGHFVNSHRAGDILTIVEELPL